MRRLSKELQRFAARPATWWIGGALLVTVVVLLGFVIADVGGRTLADRVADGGLASGALAFAVPAVIAGILHVTGARGELRATLAVEPRRDVVYRTRIAGAALGVVPGVAVAYLLYAGGAWGVHAIAGTLVPPGAAQDTTAALAAGLAWTGLRAVALAAGAAALGGAVGAMAGQWPVSALVLFISLLGLDRALRGLAGPGWPITMNARAWLAGPDATALAPAGAGPWWAAGLIVLGVVAVVVVTGLLVFRHREMR